MGLVTAHIILANPSNAELLPVHVDAVVDTDATTLCIPEHIMLQLGLQEIEHVYSVIIDMRRRESIGNPLSAHNNNMRCAIKSTCKKSQIQYLIISRWFLKLKIVLR